MTTFYLSDSDSFNRFFNNFLSGSLPKEISIDFQALIKAQKPFLKVEGQDYNASLNATIMEALLAYQRNVNRLYSLVLYNKTNKRLSEKEHQDVRIVFNVEPGSSVFDRQNLDKVLESIMSKLNGKEIACIVVVGL